MGYCPSCRHFFSSSRDKCPDCGLPLVDKKPERKKIAENYPTHKITAGRIFFRNGRVVFNI